MIEPSEFTKPTYYVDSDAPIVVAMTQGFLCSAKGPDSRSVAIALFDGVRDAIRYDPYSISLDPQDYRASRIAQSKAAFCVSKAILLTAVARAAGIPASVGFADVRNHLNSPKLRDLMESDLFIYHGYVALWLDGQWLKVTPAFNMELCDRFGVKPLVFDGRNDALFHEFDANERRHMEYVNDRGVFLDPPVDQLLEAFSTTYPKMADAIRASGSITTVDAEFHST